MAFDIFTNLKPAVQLEGHSCVRLHIKVKSVLLWIWVEAGEVLQLALREVEVGVGESCGRTLALREKMNFNFD